MRPADLAELLDLVRDGRVSHTAAKRIFGAMVETGERAGADRRARGTAPGRSDDAHCAAGSTRSSPSIPRRPRAFVAGEQKLQGVLVGAVMKKSKGRADPKRVNQLLSARTTG